MSSDIFITIHKGLDIIDQREISELELEEIMRILSRAEETECLCSAVDTDINYHDNWCPMAK